MEVRKGYKQTEVGLIPEDWEVKKLKDVAPLQRGFDLPNQFLVAGDYPVVYSNGIQNRHNKFQVKAPGIVTGRSGTIGKVTFIEEDYWPHNTSLWVTDFKNNDHRFIFYLFLRTKLERFAIGSGVPTLNRNDVHDFQVALPTKSEQIAIATALSDTDALISSLEKLIAKKRAIKQGAMQELLKPKEGWEVKTLGEIGECIIGLTYRPDNVKESGTLVLRSSNVQGNSLSFEDNVYVDITVSDKLIVQKNDILICVRNGSRDLIGKCALIEGQAIGETFGAFMSVYRSPYNEFVFNMFQSNIIKKQIDEYLGATINQITNKSLNSFEIPFPPLNEQTRISTILSDMDAEIAGLEDKLSKYKQVKQGMMQELLTGRIRLI